MKAFSLIELMVVVAIVGILSTSAVAVYKNYVINSRMSEILPIMNQIYNGQLQYAYNVGNMPLARDIGYSTEANGYEVTNVSEIHPALTQLIITNNNSGCKYRATVYGSFDPASLGFDSSQIDTVAFECYTFIVSNENNSYMDCLYRVHNSSTGAYETYNYFPAWETCATGTCTALYYLLKDGGTGQYYHYGYGKNSSACNS